MVNSIDKQLALILKDYGARVTAAVSEAQEETVQEAVRELKTRSPSDTGLYASGWTFTKTPDGYRIHNVTRPELTYILEHGYARVRGGRVAAQPHIQPVAEGLTSEFMSALERKMPK